MKNLSLIFTLFILAAGCQDLTNQKVKATVRPASKTSEKSTTPFKLTSSSMEDVESLIASSKATFIEVGSKSCFSCKVMGKHIEDVKNEHPDFNVRFVDVYESPTAMKYFNVKSIPTQIIMGKDGNTIYRHSGVLEVPKIKTLMKKHQTTRKVM